MSTWPANLPGPILEGFSKKRLTGLKSTDMEIGPPRSRRVTTSRYSEVSVKWLFTQDQYDKFITFFETALHAGSDWFDATWRIDGMRSAKSLRVKGGEFSDERQGDHWRVSATLEWRD